MKKILLFITLMISWSFLFSQVSVTLNIQNVTCFGLANGSATVNATGGTPAYSYTWLPGGQTTVNSPNLAVGQYTVLVSDATLATSSYTFFISEPAPLSVSTQYTYNCINTCSNAASTNVSGGTAPYMYLWNNGETTYEAGSLCFGNCSVQVTDFYGCIDSSTFNLSYNPITIAETHTNVTCNNICDAAISFSASGGSGNYQYTFMTANTSWPGNPVFTSTLSNLCAGGYTVNVTDLANGCMDVTAIYITAIGSSSISNATLTSTSYNETCLLSGDGSIDVTVLGSNPGPFTYLWNNGATTQDVYNLTSGSYTVAIIDNNSNCLVLYDTISSVGINCGTISGNVFIDANSDCINNTGDYGFNNMPIIINPGNRLGFTNPQGNYTVNNLPYGTYSVALNPTNINISPACTTTITTSVSSPSPTSVNNDLPVVFNAATQPDMTVFCASGGIVPGFSCSVGYGVQNLNPLNNSGQLKVTLPSLYITNLISASPNVYIISGDTIIWSFNNLGYYNYTPFSAYFYVPINTPLGSTFTSCAYVETTVPDLNYANNTNCYTRLVTGAFDPNDKTVSPIGVGLSGEIHASVTDLTYLIRFQNTGNGPAVNIVVKDTLSPNVNVNTFEMLGSSHNYDIDILPGNVLRWKFNNIMLADSNSNEPASHGYIQYRIKRTNNNTPGTQIKNTAYIYFDFNTPVVTNTAINTIELLAGIQPFSKDNELAVYPNPTNSILNIIDKQNQFKNSTIEIKNYLGQVVFALPFTNQINLSDLSAGMYFLTLHDKENKKTIKIIKQ